MRGEGRREERGERRKEERRVEDDSSFYFNEQNPPFHSDLYALTDTSALQSISRIAAQPLQQTACDIKSTINICNICPISP